MMISRPKEITSWLKHYIGEVPDESLIDGLKRQTQASLEFFSSLTDEQLDHRYAEGKWSIREILVHLIDSERVFSYRALRFSRRDATELPGYDENWYIPNSNAAERSAKSLIEEYIVVRTATVALFSNLTDDMLDFVGTANGGRMSARELGFATLGHEMHHIRIIRERYLI
jgi:hypothetical protein